jgi:hypothetical protein
MVLTRRLPVPLGGKPQVLFGAATLSATPGQLELGHRVSVLGRHGVESRCGRGIRLRLRGIQAARHQFRAGLRMVLVGRLGVPLDRALDIPRDAPSLPKAFGELELGLRVPALGRFAVAPRRGVSIASGLGRIKKARCELLGGGLAPEFGRSGVPPQSLLKMPLYIAYVPDAPGQFEAGWSVPALRGFLAKPHCVVCFSSILGRFEETRGEFCDCRCVSLVGRLGVPLQRALDIPGDALPLPKTFGQLELGFRVPALGRFRVIPHGFLFV